MLLKRSPSLLNRWRVALAVCVALTTPFAVAQDGPTPTEFQVIQLSAGIHLIQAEVAITFSEHAKGLMFRERLGTNQGMVFLYDEPGVQCMWMKNTLIPLSVAFMGNDGKILNIEDMQPQTETSHCSVKPARYSLEMNLGWFAKRGLKVGSQIDGLPKPKY